MTLLALMAASLASAPLATADRADLRCIGVFAMMAGEDAEEKAGMTGAIMYYIGRIEGRGSRLDLDRSLNAAIEELVTSAETLDAEARRCGGEMVIKGDEIQNIGKAVPAEPAQQAGKK